MSEVFDLSVKGADFQPLPVTGRHRRALRTAILNMLRKIPGATDGVMASYSKHQTEWFIPPLYNGNLNGVGLQVSLDEPLTAEPYTAFADLMAAIYHGGWGGKVPAQLKRRLGPLAENRSLLSVGSPDLTRIAAEYAMMHSRAFSKSFVMTSDTAAVRVPHKGQWRLIGIADGRLFLPEHGIDIAVSAQQLFDWLFEPKGTVKTYRYGVYDRISTWSTANFEQVENLDELTAALSLLKLSCKDEEEAEFEQDIRNANVQVEPEKGPGLYTLENLDRLRDVWIDSETLTPEKAFQEFFTAAVPYYMDSVKFKDIFGLLPTPDLRLTPKQYNRINSGMDSLSNLFLTANRKHNGRRRG